MSKFIAFVIVALFFAQLIYCETTYYNISNNFGKFGEKCYSKIADNNLCIPNLTNQTIINTIPIINPQNDYSFEIRFSNTNNTAGKKYRYIKNSKKYTVVNPIWGIIWNHKDSINYMKLEIKCTNSNLYDMLDERYMELKLIQVNNNISITLDSAKLTEHINLRDGMNSFLISKTDSTYSIIAGDKELRPIFTYHSKTDSTATECGYFIGSGANVVVSRATFKDIPNRSESLKTTWSISAIDKYLKTSTDVFEGYWSYLDRNFQDRNVRLGGIYKIALISNNVGGYYIIYISGASINTTEWKEGLIKGILTPTRFLNHYNLVWYDSKMEIDNNEVSADFTDNVILKLNFPIEKSSIRFFKE